MRERDEGLSEPLGRAAALLREEIVPREEWRAALLGRAAAQLPGREPAAAARRWSVRPAAAIAACVACLVAGAAIALGVVRGRAGPEQASVTAIRSTASRALPVRFALVAPGAARVSIVGDFNGWNPAGLPMRRLPDGRTWEVEIGLPPGRYAYSFVVDGRLARDSSAAEAGTDDFGVPNSVVLVSGS
ncbi:MAG TPA: isoamylase early set domain-containing protein [Gemmatimonadaceae bacterium]|jgi:hypothetical protein